MSAPRSENLTAFVGLTGSVAAGKSTALEILGSLGAETLSSDAVVHALLATERVRDLLVARWGARVAPDGEVDRGRVASIVFDEPDELAWLERTLHPLVHERVAAWHEQLAPGTRLAVVEIPLLFETGFDAVFDATISVVAPDPVRAERAGARGTSELEGRSQRQLAQEEKASRATYVVENAGSVDQLAERLAEVVSELESERRSEGGA